METLLPGGDEVEILIVDDGSTDRTAEIADEYERKYPNIVRAIHKENGGHGDAVTTGIRNATGLFFKVVDSDDSLAPEAYKQVLDFLRRIVKKNHELDMLISILFTIVMTRMVMCSARSQLIIARRFQGDVSLAGKK